MRVAVFRGAAGAAVGIAGLWNFLIDDAVEILLGIEVVVPMKDDGDVVLDE